MNGSAKRFLTAMGLAMSLVIGGVSAVVAADLTPREDRLNAKAALATSQAAIGRSVGDYAFVDTEGRPVRITDFLGKPLVLSFVYSSCSFSCPIITERLADAINVAAKALGQDAFRVASVGFDVANDTPRRLANYARQHNVDAEKWPFLSGELPEVAGLGDAVGFVYYPTSAGFDHLDQVTVIDKEGRVYRQIYGESFDIPKLVEALKDLVFNAPQPYENLDEFWKKVRWFCTVYDPASERYRFKFGIFIQFGVGGIIISWMAWFVITNWVRIRRLEQKQKRRADRFSA